MSGAPVEISVVIPCYNEEANVIAIHAAVKEELRQHAASHEIILIDNGSVDTTRELMRAIASADPHTRVILNSRNFGQMRSPTYAIYQAEGQAVIAMSADFQDSPAMIGPFIAQWRAGAQVVMAQRRSEQTSLVLGVVRRVGYAFLNRFGDYPVIPGATGFGLYSREVVDMLASWNEPEPFFRGMAVESGYRLAVLPFDRPERSGGRSSNGYWQLLDFALSGLAGSARKLLRLPLILALHLAPLTVLLGLVTAVRWAVQGYSPLLVSLTVLLGIFATLLLFIGLIADQLRLVVERLRNVPLVVEAERINFPAGREKPAQRSYVAPLRMIGR